MITVPADIVVQQLGNVLDMIVKRDNNNRVAPHLRQLRLDPGTVFQRIVIKSTRDNEAKFRILIG